MPYKLIGRTTNQCGKRLWEILGHLKDFGEGRMVVRHTYAQNYPEPTFYRVVLARPQMDTGEPNRDEDYLKGRVLVERVFRGKNDGLVDLSKAAYKPDFRLVHKHEEAKYIEAFRQCKEREVRVVSPFFEMPPLLKMVAERDGHAAKHLKAKVCHTNKNIRIAEEGEEATEKFDVGLGTPLSPELYQGVV